MSSRVAEANTRGNDLRTLRLIAERPETATSQDRIRLALGANRNLVYASLGRLLNRGWVSPPEKQRQPYTLTAAGRKALLDGDQL